jgi:hypothetical protein
MQLRHQEADASLNRPENESACRQLVALQKKQSLASRLDLKSARELVINPTNADYNRYS